MRIIAQLKDILKRRNSRISPLAVLHKVDYYPTTSIKSLAKLERAKVGRCTYIGTMTAAYDCSIGNFCSIARECYVGGANHPIEWVTTSPCFHLKDNATGKCFAENHFEWSKKTVIENDVWLGTRTMVLAGVTIHTGAVIGAGSVVTKDVGAYEIWAGNPARFIRKRFDDDTIEKLLKTRWWDYSDETLRNLGVKVTNPDLFIEAVEENL